ncbi:E3 ubiquitin-protein ligase RNF149-like [Durio zibethinus]|uniref:E3 ubiquitin-protein ligase RNF149-like n=1 Tax=Durio zibethinus TaxID=66656 RepID=A0A6P5Y5D5_DURZI|nr:E3 ubiquitin-protein ligase RNF149-like [Durio zibethinus]
MGIALVFSTLALSSLLLYFIHVWRRYLPSFIRESTVPQYVTLIATQLEWACDFWLCYSLFPNYNYVPKMPAETDWGERAVEYEWKRAALAALADAGQCPVCLFRVAEGEEIGELRCGHVFHRFCLETWVGYNNVTCPLCRLPLAPTRLVSDDQLGRDVLVFEFCSVSSRDRGRWWVR